MILRPGKDPVCEGTSITTLRSNLFVCVCSGDTCNPRGGTDKAIITWHC